MTLGIMRSWKSLAISSMFSMVGGVTEARKVNVSHELRGRKSPYQAEPSVGSLVAGFTEPETQKLVEGRLNEQRSLFSIHCGREACEVRRQKELPNAPGLYQGSRLVGQTTGHATKLTVHGRMVSSSPQWKVHHGDGAKTRRHRTFK